MAVTAAKIPAKPRDSTWSAATMDTHVGTRGVKNVTLNASSWCDDDIIGDNDDSNKPAATDCASDETLYRLDMYDSFGDGWDDTTLTITPTDDKKYTVFDGSLEDGAKGTQYVCLSRTKKCHVEVLYL
jgi:hypothetical protein